MRQFARESDQNTDQTSVLLVTGWCEVVVSPLDARQWRRASDEERRQKARADRRQLSIFGEDHTRELLLQAERREELRDDYAWKYRRTRSAN